MSALVSEVGSEAGSSVVVSGHWYPALSSDRRAATLMLDGRRFRLAFTPPSVRAEESEGARWSEAAEEGEAAKGEAADRDESDPVIEGDADSLDISDRLGATARRITFEDASLFETADNASIDAWLGSTGHAARRSIGIHRLENSGRMIVLSLVATIAVVFSVFRWGLPAGAEYLSNRLPVAAHETIGSGTLATMDRLLLDESELDAERQAEIDSRFRSMVQALPDQGFTLKLHFRRLGDIPNAFALPGGDVVVTDALVDLVENPDELDSVLLHEIGHVHERHGMQQAIQASAITLVLALSIGDVGALGEIAAGIPVFLLQSNYSRRAETEADEFAFAGMAATGRDPKHFATIIRRLSESGRPRAPDETEKGGQDRENVDATDKSADKSASDWYSSHPDAERRALRALEVSRKMANGSYQPSFPDP